MSSRILMFPAGFSCPDGFDPLEFHTLLQQARKEAKEQIEKLLSFLDRTDIDPDLEDGADDEPYLAGYQFGALDDLEMEDEHDESTNDEEPSLGSMNPTTCGFGGVWSVGKSNDLEDEHDGSEASLCGVTFGAPGSTELDLEEDNEREDDPAEHGYGDLAGRQEQDIQYWGYM